MSNEVSYWSWLPYELKWKIFDSLAFNEVCRIALVSKEWSQLSKDRSLWYEKIKKTWKLSPDQIFDYYGIKADTCSMETFKSIYLQRRAIERNRNQGKCLFKSKRCHEQVLLSLTIKGNILITGSLDSTIKIWDANTLEHLQTLRGHQDGVVSLDTNKTYIVSGSHDNTIMLWNLTDFQRVHTLKGHGGWVMCLQCDNEKIVSGSWDSTIRIWSIKLTKETKTLLGHKGAVTCLQFDETKIISGSSDKTIRIWDLTEGNCLHVLTGHYDLIRCLRFDRDKLVTGSFDQSIRIWSLDTLKNVKTLRGHIKGVRCLFFLEDKIISGSRDGTVKVWKYLNDIPLPTFWDPLSSEDQQQQPNLPQILQFHNNVDPEVEEELEWILQQQQGGVGAGDHNNNNNNNNNNLLHFLPQPQPQEEGEDGVELGTGMFEANPPKSCTFDFRANFPIVDLSSLNDFYCIYADYRQIIAGSSDSCLKIWDFECL